MMTLLSLRENETLKFRDLKFSFYIVSFGIFYTFS